MNTVVLAGQGSSSVVLSAWTLCGASQPAGHALMSTKTAPGPSGTISSLVCAHTGKEANLFLCAGTGLPSCPSRRARAPVDVVPASARCRSAWVRQTCSRRRAHAMYHHGAAVLPRGRCSHGQEPVLGAWVAGKEDGDSEPWPQRCLWGIGDCGEAPH